MKALTKLRRIAKQFGYKVSIKSFSFGRSISLLNEDGSAVGNVFVAGCPRLKNLLEFKAAIPEGLMAQVKEEEDDPMNKITGWSVFEQVAA